MIELDVLSKADVAADGQPRQWRSFAHRDQAPGAQALAASEFHPAATEEGGDEPERRTFMKTMGAAMALAGVGLSGCRRPVEHIVPYVRKPEEIIPGIANFYATAMPMRGIVHPLLVESHEGRPTKVEGNPEHPAALGRTDRFAQASVLNLYDPDRTRIVRREGAEATWSDFVAQVRQIGAGARIAVLAAPNASPTQLRLREQLAGRFASLRWITHRTPGEAAQVAGIGAGVRPLYRLSEAQTIVSFDSDFLMDPVSGVWNHREFAVGRRLDGPEDEMSRVYAIESTMTVTGGMADHRLRMKAGRIPQFATAVAAALGQGGTAAAALDARAQAFVQAIAEDAQAGPTVFMAGETQPAAVHALCATLNAAFGGGAVEYVSTGEPEEEPFAEAMTRLTADLQNGQVDVLVCLGTNPAYDVPGFVEAMARAPLSIVLSELRDETAVRATWALPRAHYLESWGDGRAIDGTYTLVQPLIAPLYEAAHSEIELLNLLATGQDVGGYDLVRATVGNQGLVAGGFEDGWRTLLHDGFAPDSSLGGGSPAAATETALVAAPAEGEVELVFRSDYHLLDGTFSNNPWMLELPHPVSKLTWDNVAVVSPATAERLGVRMREGSYEGGRVQAGKIHATLLTISVNGQSVELPAWIQPGHPDDSITVTTGWGHHYESDRRLKEARNLFDRIFTVDTDHWRYGPIGNEIGVSVAPLATAGAAVVPNVAVEATGGGYLLASTQDHGSMENRPIIRMATVDEFRENPTFSQQAMQLIGDVPWEEYEPIWGEKNSAHNDPRIGEAMYADHQWGMTIDLNTCTGCNACVVACQAENNISVVGKDEVSRGREMHWMRLDRYYVGEDVSEASMAMMPMLCQHCEYAPCESVCPVAATVHSPDGLNEMVYNRCIGTRYCSNNCPYKVRRYNWFNWTKELPIENRMQLNPNVTPRFRGVMEKCTWCVQRIRETFQVANQEDRKIRDGEVQTACQQACPADAIVFGDLTDPESRVSRSKRGPRRYELLEEYNIRPRLSYLARISNPNPRLAAALAEPTA